MNKDKTKNSTGEDKGTAAAGKAVDQKKSLEKEVGKGFADKRKETGKDSHKK